MVWSLIAAIIIPNVGAWICTAVVFKHIAWFKSPQVKKPWFNPPGWALGIIWTALYCCMGYASYLVYKETGGFTQEAVLPLSLYGVTLLVNWTWVTVYLAVKNGFLSFIHMLTIDALVIASIVSFSMVNASAAYLMIPLAAWLIVDTAITYYLWKLNKDKMK